MPSGMMNSDDTANSSSNSNDQRRPARRSRKVSGVLASACDLGGPCSECSLAVFCFGESGALKKDDLLTEVVEEDEETNGFDLIAILQKDIERNLLDTKEKINQTFDKLAAVMDERRKELLRKADFAREKKINILRAERRKHTHSVGEVQIEDGHSHLALSKSYSTSMKSLIDTQDGALNGLSNLQGGTLRFSYDKNIIDNIKSIGEIEITKASALHSKASGLGLNYTFADEEAHFEIVTRDQCMRDSFRDDDEIKVKIIDPKGQEIESTLKGIPTPDCQSKHVVTYTPANPGVHKVHVLVNKLEMLGSPFSVMTFRKEKMTFDSETYLTSDGLLESKDSYIVQKGQTSALLTEKGSSGAIIFGAEPLSSGKHAWKVRFTSACPSLHTSVGVSSRTNVFDVDIEHTCEFEMNNVNNKSHRPLRKTRSARKLSSFQRTSSTYMVVLDLDSKTVRILCCESQEGKTLKVPDNFDALYPCVYMTHQCSKGSHCPRPMVAFI